MSDFISTSSIQKTCFPYHEFEQKIIRLKDFKKYSGWCGTNRLYISLIFSQKKEDDYGIVGTFLIDTGASFSFVQPSLLDDIDSQFIYRDEGTDMLFCLGLASMF
jgi:hypothetical protein